MLQDPRPCIYMPQLPWIQFIIISSNSCSKGFIRRYLNSGFKIYAFLNEFPLIVDLETTTLGLPGNADSMPVIVTNTRQECQCSIMRKVQIVLWTKKWTNATTQTFSSRRKRKRICHGYLQCDYCIRRRVIHTLIFLAVIFMGYSFCWLLAPLIRNFRNEERTGLS